MQWDLTRLYQSFSDPAFAADLSSAETLTEKLSETLASSSDDHLTKLRTLINMMNQLEALTARLSSLVMLTLAVDTENEEALAVHDKMQSFYVRLKQQYSAFNRYVGSLDCLESLIEQDDLIREHAFVLRETAKKSRHTLDPALEETVLKLRITGSGAWSQLRGMLESTVHFTVNVYKSVSGSSGSVDGSDGDGSSNDNAGGGAIGGGGAAGGGGAGAGAGGGAAGGNTSTDKPEDGKPDDYRYCVVVEGNHVTYHRYTPEDYNDFGF